MEKLKWCLGRKGGIRLTEPNPVLAGEYLENAEESLRVLESIKETKSRMWLAATKYYIEYFAVYAFLMKAGIRCEIHDCTIELARRLEKDGFFAEGTADMLEEDKELRIDNQYYLKNRPVDIDIEKLRGFVLDMKKRADNLANDDIRKIRMVLARAGKV
jgi:uncharacterized protein (UPF0332 family)